MVELELQPWPPESHGVKCNREVQTHYHDKASYDNI